MTSAKILEVIERYRQVFLLKEIGRADYPHDQFLEGGTEVGLAHCHQMLDKMILFVLRGKTDKAFRWLGFVQGVLWANRIFTLTELKNHSRPRESTEQ